MSMMTDSSNLVRLTKARIRPAAEMFARAFQDYPLFAGLIPDASERKLLLPDIFQFMIRFGVLYGEVYATSPDLEGISVWFSSEKAEMTLWKMIRIGGLPLIYHYFRMGRCISRLVAYNKYAFKLHNRHAHFPHWYLFLVGIDPKFQGRGHASALIRPMLGRIDQEHLPCYLETQNRENVSMYEHYGFELVQLDTIPGTDVNHWAMLRKKSG